jgi:septum formation protein
VNALRLASASTTRQAMLRAAGLQIEVVPARIDEAEVLASLAAEGVRPRDMADALAEVKARKVGRAHPQGLTLGADQVLEFQGQALGKPDSPQAAAELLGRLAGQVHHLHAAAVVYQQGAPIWRHVASVRMQMRPLTAAYIAGYVQRNWATIRHSAGGYLIEAEGIRLFSAIGADYHAILGLPLLQLLNWLVLRGDVEA